MYKKTFSFFFLFILYACQSKDILVNDVFSEGVDLQSQMIENNVKVDIPVNYFDNGDFSYFTKVERLEDRFSFCDISEEMAKTMTTDAIVRSVLHYPLNYLIFAYNNPINAVKLVIDSSHLHQELLLREDAAETILHYFEKSDIDMNVSYPSLDESYQHLTYADEMFLEYLIASWTIKGFEDSGIKNKLYSIVDDKEKRRSMNTATYSEYSIRPLSIIKHKIATVQNTLTTSTIYTYFGQVLGVIINQELTAWEITNITNNYVEAYPQAEMVRPASARYNCHSYAWYDQSTNNHYWLNRLNSNGFLQLSRYWTDDLYVMTTETNAEKVYYVSSDHSAIPLSSTLYISKWGTAPLMKHAPSYSPYSTTNMQYYRQRSLPYNISLHIVGDRLIAVNTSHNYSLPHYYNNMSISWSAEPFPGISGNCYVTVNLDGSCSFSADTPGAYYIYFEGYRNDELIITANYDVVVAYGI